MTVVVVISRYGFFASLNQSRHIALVGWKRPMYYNGKGGGV